MRNLPMKCPTFVFCFLITPTIWCLSSLDVIIDPEIKNDDFYVSLYRFAKSENISTILEIGASSGDGSTEALVAGILDNPRHPTLYCIEISKPRFANLKKRYSNLPCVKPYNASSVPLESFPSEEELLAFIYHVPTNLSSHGGQTVLGWLRQDIEYVKNANLPTNGIELIKKENNIDCFDMVLIDGSEFTGSAELNLLYGAKIILLDDISGFKNYTNFRRLCNDSTYTLIQFNMRLRNGYAIFQKNN